jgi:hypothetical protein
MSLYSLIYSNYGKPDLGYHELKYIMEKSEKNNQLDGITGLLCYGDSVQGTENAVSILIKCNFHKVLKLTRNMNYEIARKLLINQTNSPDNPDTLLSRLQQGKPPVPGQITSTLLALKVVFEASKTDTSLDRELAFALYQLAVKAQRFFAAGRKVGVDWPPLLNQDLVRISLAAESIFSGTWQKL